MKSREVLDRTLTPDGEPLELAREAGHYVIRVAGVPLMTSAVYGSEQALARLAAEKLGRRGKARILVGGLGMGYTLRAALDAFGPDARITVAELLPAVVRYNEGPLASLASRPLADPRVRLFEGDVRVPLGAAGAWDAVLLDVDNGPDAFTSTSNASLYSRAGVTRLARALAPGGVVSVWSAFPSPSFERRLQQAGLRCETHRVHARGETRKGSRHVIFVARAVPGGPRGPKASTRFPDR